MIDSSYENDAVKIRRDLHQIPEIGFQEFKTQKYIMDYLNDLGLHCEKCAQTGVICYMDMKQDVTIALRSDMDGLPIIEQNNVPYKSTHSGKMHACGHDGHMSILLLLAKYIVRENVKLNKNILLIFQPAEEGPGGAVEVIKENILKKYQVKHVFGFHLSPEYPMGILAAAPEEFFASGVELSINVIGKAAHGAQPHKGKDAVLIASQLIINLHTIISRSLNPLNEGILTIGTFHAGDELNIIAENALLTGIVRAFNEDSRENILYRVKNICDGIAVTYDCVIDLNIKYTYPPLINNRNLYDKIKTIMADDFMTAEKVMLAEDFSYYTQQVPSFFMFLGTNEGPQKPSYPLHNSKFDFNEIVLVKGMQAYLKIIENV